MSGVRPGSRLERLHALAAKVAHEIAAETARERDASAGRVPAEVARVEPVRTPRPTDGPDATVDALTALGVPPAEVRTWARGAGIEVAARGNLPRHVVDAYADAHPPA